MSRLSKLFLDELGDILHVEELLQKALPKMRDAAEAADLKKLISNHLTQTQNQATRLQKVFALFELPAREKKCEAMLGLLVECQQLIQRSKPSPTLDAALVCALQKIESYEAISYRSLASWAKLLGEKEAAKHLAATLTEEESAFERLSSMAADFDKRASEDTGESVSTPSAAPVKSRAPVPAF
jgi:ferritin-like metal-binding protein YciE